MNSKMTDGSSDESGAAAPDNVVYADFNKQADIPPSVLGGVSEMLATGKSAREGARLAYNFINKCSSDHHFTEWVIQVSDPTAPMATKDLAKYIEGYCKEVIDTGVLSDPNVFDESQIQDICTAYQYFKLIRQSLQCAELFRQFALA